MTQPKRRLTNVSPETGLFYYFYNIYTNVDLIFFSNIWIRGQGYGTREKNVLFLQFEYFKKYYKKVFFIRNLKKNFNMILKAFYKNFVAVILRFYSLRAHASEDWSKKGNIYLCYTRLVNYKLDYLIHTNVSLHSGLKWTKNY